MFLAARVGLGQNTPLAAPPQLPSAILNGRWERKLSFVVPLLTAVATAWLLIATPIPREALLGALGPLDLLCFVLTLLSYVGIWAVTRESFEDASNRAWLTIAVLGYRSCVLSIDAETLSSLSAVNSVTCPLVSPVVRLRRNARTDAVTSSH